MCWTTEVFHILQHHRAPKFSHPDSPDWLLAKLPSKQPCHLVCCRCSDSCQVCGQEAASCASALQLHRPDVQQWPLSSQGHRALGSHGLNRATDLSCKQDESEQNCRLYFPDRHWCQQICSIATRAQLAAAHQGHQPYAALVRCLIAAAAFHSMTREVVSDYRQHAGLRPASVKVKLPFQTDQAHQLPAPLLAAQAAAR